jgi:hypothetical protein
MGRKQKTASKLNYLPFVKNYFIKNYALKAAAPPTISDISVVIAA